MKRLVHTSEDKHKKLNADGHILTPFEKNRCILFGSFSSLWSVLSLLLLYRKDLDGMLLFYLFYM